ncbi:hypothetical protein [Peribacillus sp. NPDC058075]|uniref:hypothetical protein n=1 Tax=unclassified Peribacillus TaxID=2675266 RepID=UPI0036DD4F45
MTMPSLTEVGPEIHVQDKTVYNRLDDWISISAFLDWNKPNVMKKQEEGWLYKMLVGFKVKTPHSKIGTCLTYIKCYICFLG